MLKTLTLLSLGSRGVGKTVFLASNCAEIFRARQRDKQPLKQWFECNDSDTQQKIESLLEFIIRNQQYPPATFKISNFNFSLKQKELGRVKTLCNLKWLDVPGEWCNLSNKEFQSALFQSHGCCVFVDTQALLQDEKYLKKLEQTINQVETILSLVERNKLIQYPIALICTKYDLIDSSSMGLIQLEEKLHPLVHRIESSRSIYQRFYSAIPLTAQKTGGIFSVKDPSLPLHWITSQLRKIHGSGTSLSLGAGLESVLPNVISFPPPSREAVKGPSPKQLIFIAIASCGLMGGVSALVLMQRSQPQSAILIQVEQKVKDFNEVLERDPNNVNAIAGIVDTYSSAGAYDRAILRLEKLFEKSPKSTYILTELVELYRISGQEDQVENSYNRILAIENNNMLALLGKAHFKLQNGDLEEAKKLYQTAEKYAPTLSMKAEIQTLARKTLANQ